MRQTEVLSKKSTRTEKIRTKGIIFSRKEPGLEKAAKIETPFEKRLFVKNNEKIFKFFLEVISKQRPIKKEISKQQVTKNKDDSRELEQNEAVIKTILYLFQQVILFQNIIDMQINNKSIETLNEQTQSYFGEDAVPEEVRNFLIQNQNINMQAVIKYILTIFFLINQVVF